MAADQGGDLSQYRHSSDEDFEQIAAFDTERNEVSSKSCAYIQWAMLACQPFLTMPTYMALARVCKDAPFEGGKLRAYLW